MHGSGATRHNRDMAQVAQSTPTAGSAFESASTNQQAQWRAAAQQVTRWLPELAEAIKGEIESSALTRAQYATDASNYRVPPAVVVFPQDAADVREILAWARAHRLPVTSRGGGTSTAGNSIGAGVIIEFSRHMNKIIAIDREARTARVQPGVVMSDLQAAAAKYGLRFGPDPSTQNRATFGGMIGNNACGPHAVAYGKTAENVLALRCIDGRGREFVASSDERRGRAAAAASAGQDSGDAGAPVAPRAPKPWDPIVPAGADADTASSAVQAAQPAPQADALRELVATHLGEIRTELGRFGRQVSGYSLEWLLPERHFDLAKMLVGTEGTLVTVLEATLRLVPIAQAPMLVVLGYPDMATAADAVPALLAHHPLAIEGMDAALVGMVRKVKGEIPELPAGQGWLMVEVGAREGEDAAIVPARAQAIAEASASDAVMIKPAGPEATTLWRIRADGAGLGGSTPEGAQAWPGWEDSAVPPAHLGEYLRALRTLMDQHGLQGLMYGHFGDGCVHVRIDFPFDTAAGVPIFREFMEQAADLAASFGGSLSGEHGDGRARSELLPRMYTPAMMALFAQVKTLFDPDNLLNPGVLVAPAVAAAERAGTPADGHPPYSPALTPLDSNLRRVSAQPVPYAGGFHFHEHEGDFTKAVHVCTGVGKCRANNTAAGGWMCPSYQATKQEKDVTRGRMRILQELTQKAPGAVVQGFADQSVLGALDLCLACKACSKDCPTGADMSRFRSETLFRAYKGKLRPRTHYVLGNLPALARLVTAVPGAAQLANAALAVPPLRKLAFTVAGFDARRLMPGFATKRFSRLARRKAELPAAAVRPDPGVARYRRDPKRSEKRAGSPLAGAGQEKTAAPRYVMLWADSFSDTLDTRGAQAMVELLQKSGYTVLIPPEEICCGLTSITTGQLTAAKKKLTHLLRVLAPFAAERIPIVGVEPSCTAVLRDDVLDLLPGDARAPLVSEMTFTLAELLTHPAFGVTPEKLADLLPDLHGVKVIAQPHCHHYSVMGWQADAALLRQAGAELQILTGCCGMAGNFGMERGHYEISVKVAQNQLLPALQAPDAADAVYLADGFSCRTQAQQLAGKQGVHLAQLLLHGAAA